jgi:hypothetical protein
MYDLTRFALSDLAACGAALRKLGAGAASMEEVANRVVRHLYDELGDPDAPLLPSSAAREEARGGRACALVRLFKTHPFSALDGDLQAFAQRSLDGRPPPGLRCLVLMASAGDRPEWNARRASAGHQAVPLAGDEVLRRSPMLSQLVTQFGLDPRALLQPDPALLVDLAQKSYNVFHVAHARDSPFVPCQEEFVIPCRIESVLGFGGLLPGGDLFAVILFSRAFIPRVTADLFKILALSAKLALLPFASGPVFAAAERAGRAAPRADAALAPA